MSEQFLELFAALAAEFEPGQVKQRPQGNRKIDYITARVVMNRLDEVLGPANWWDEYAIFEHSVVCQLTIRLPDGTTITKCDAGGAAGMSDQGDDDKSMYSDALKRAAVKFGIARYLYRDGVPRFVQEAGRPSRPPAALPGKPPAAAHHAANHPNGTGHGSGAYAKPESVKDLTAWISAKCDEVNAKWLDSLTQMDGTIIQGEAEVVRTFQLVGHLLKYARLNGWVNAPENPAPSQREKFLAVAWERHRGEVEAEATDYCRHLWREARAKLPKPPEDESDDVPDEMTEEDVWPAGRE